MEEELQQRFFQIPFNTNSIDDIFLHAFNCGSNPVLEQNKYYKVLACYSDMSIDDFIVNNNLLPCIEQNECMNIFDISHSSKVNIKTALSFNERNLLYYFCIGIIYSNFMQVQDFDILIYIICSRYYNTWKYLIDINSLNNMYTYFKKVKILVLD